MGTDKTTVSEGDLIAIAATLPPERGRMVLAALAARHGDPEPETLEEFTARAAAAFERDMQPIATAIAEALHKGDLAALQGLRGMLPALLAEVNRNPALADLLAYQLGETFLKALNERPE